MTDHAAIVREALLRHPRDEPSGMIALDALVAERDRIRSAAEWLLANRGHRGEAQAWKLLADALKEEEA